MSNLISIIVPAFNVQNHISLTLNSLLSQDDKEFEIIIINDGSTDDTLKVSEEIMRKSDFSNYKIIDKINGGVSSARNRGIQESTGEYLYFLDGDDYISSDMISTVKSYINVNKTDVIAWGYNLVREDNSTISEYFDTYEFKLSKMTGEEALRFILIKPNVLRIWTCSAVYRKDLIIGNDLFYTKGCSNGEDQEFSYKVLSRAKEVYLINKVLSFYVQRNESISNSYSIKRFDAIFAIDRTANYIKKNSININKEILHNIENNYMIDNYLYNFNSCIYYLCSRESMSIIKAINYLKNDINTAYPGLVNLIEKKIKTVKKVDLLTNFLHKLYLINPVMYVFIMILRRKIKSN